MGGSSSSPIGGAPGGAGLPPNSPRIQKPDTFSSQGSPFDSADDTEIAGIFRQTAVPESPPRLSRSFFPHGNIEVWSSPPQAESPKSSVSSPGESGEQTLTKQVEERIVTLVAPPVDRSPTPRLVPPLVEACDFPASPHLVFSSQPPTPQQGAMPPKNRSGSYDVFPDASEVPSPVTNQVAAEVELRKPVVSKDAIAVKEAPRVPAANSLISPIVPPKESAISPPSLLATEAALKQCLEIEKKDALAQQKSQHFNGSFDSEAAVLRQSLPSKIKSFFVGIGLWFSNGWANFRGKREVGVACLPGSRGTTDVEYLNCSMSFSVGSSTKTAEVFGVCEGHGGGKGAAVFAKERFTHYLKEAIERSGSSELSDAVLYQAFQEAFVNLDKAYTGKGGAAMNVAILIDGNLWECNLGDARAVLVKNGNQGDKEDWGAEQLSEDQTCMNEKYAQEVRNLGGSIVLVQADYGFRGPEIGQRYLPYVRGQEGSKEMVNVPGSIGDHNILTKDGRNCILHKPRITKIKAKKGDCLVMANGELWLMCSSSQAAYNIKRNESSKGKISNQDAAEMLRNKARNLQSASGQPFTKGMAVLVVSL